MPHLLFDKPVAEWYNLVTRWMKKELQNEMMYQEYDEQTLQRLQHTELEILKDFDDLCDKHQIDYFGVGGTAIGAVRHQGFIPWDDDIDIGMLRKDYDRFLQIAEKELGEKYEILNFETNTNYPLPTTRLVKKGTVFQEYAMKGIDCNFGIFLDIYFFDNIADGDKAMRRQGKTAWFWGKLLILRKIARPTLYYSGLKASLITAACVCAHFFLRLFRISPRFLYSKAMKASRRYEDTPTKRVAYFFDPTPFTSIMKLDDIVPTKKMPFNGLMIKFPGNIHAYLERRYGDYMTLPPEDKRHNHPPMDLDFGE